MSIDTSTLTGESVPVSVEPEEAAFAGTFVVEGEGIAVVTATGTRLASIAQLTRAGRHPRTPLAQELDRVVRTVAAIAVGVGGVFFVTALFIGTPASSGFLFAIGVTVALVPEGLLPTVTLSLAMGAQRMAGRHALVRHLESVETLGSTTFICTDKTGTLTRNEMSVVEAWTPAGRAWISGTGYEPEGSVEAEEKALPALRRLAYAAVRCSTGRAIKEENRWVARGDPMEAAIHAFAGRLGIDVETDERRTPVTKRFPFDPRRRRMSVMVEDRLLVKGAPDSVLPRCRSADGAGEALGKMTRRGLRVIAVAERPGAGISAAASGAAFSAVVLGQVANAFACRSASRWPGSLGWTSNRLLLGAIAVELLALAGFLFIPPLASLLGHAPPPLWGWGVAVLAIPAVLAVDAVHKLVGTREEDGSPRSTVGRTGTR